MKKITFLLNSQFNSDIPAPVPASELVPKWYRAGEMFINKRNNTLKIDNEEDKSAGLRLCMPFFDSLTSGYFLTTWADIEITKNEGGVVEYRYLELTSKGFYTSIPDAGMVNERHGEIGHTMPRPHGHSHNHMVWASQWGWRVPKGWSVLVTHPLNQFQLPFTTSSAIVDSDRFASHGNMPFFLKEGWTGIIEKGTPYAQLIPIKRSSWFSTAKRQDTEALFTAHQARRVPYGYYRGKLWVPKRYKKDLDVQSE